VPNSRTTKDRRPNLDRCTIPNWQGDPCGKPSREDAPFAICPEHLVWAYRHVSKQIGSLADDTLFRAQFAMENIAAARERDRRAVAGRQLVVYYVQVGDHIKIGYTYNLRQRLNSYPPSRRVLALEEVDSPNVETRRHNQFRHLLALGNEWFHPGPDLIEHINELRRRMGAQPIELAA
jgi:hypothetical protein